jgi:hypothetical protein
MPATNTDIQMQPQAWEQMVASPSDQASAAAQQQVRKRTLLPELQKNQRSRK